MDSSPRTDFAGGAFDPSLPDGRSGAQLHLLADRVRADFGGGRRLELTYIGMRIERGGASGRMVFVRGPGNDPVFHSEERGFIDALRAAAGGTLDDQLTALLDGERQRDKRRLGIWFFSLVAIVVLGWGLWLGAGWASGRAIEELPLDIDRKLGDMSEASESLGKDLADPLPLKAVETIVERLKPFVKTPGFDWRPRVIEDSQLNAFALPGGRFVALSGLIAKSERAEQVAGVIAHEMAHVTCRHSLKHVARSLGVVAAVQLLFGDASGIVAIGAQGATLAVLTGYSREMEREADAEGARMLAAAGLDPRGMIEFFTLLKSQPGTEMPDGLGWMSTHPQHDERIAALEALIPTLAKGPAATLALDWDAVRKAAGYVPAAAPATP